LTGPEVLADLPGVRRAEMDAAREILGVRQEFLGFEDSGLPLDGGSSRGWARCWTSGLNGHARWR
jgi:LmbE family N-acetylglucosaminyl deacetylase